MSLTNNLVETITPDYVTLLILKAYSRSLRLFSHLHRHVPPLMKTIGGKIEPWRTDSLDDFSQFFL